MVLILVTITAITNYNYSSRSILKQCNNEEIIFRAKVINVKNNEHKRYTSYDCSITGINNYKLKKPEKTIIYFSSPLKKQNNIIIEGRGNVKEISSTKNKLVFNYKEYLRHNKINSTIYCDNNNVLVIKSNYSFYNKIKNSFRNYVENIFYSKVDSNNANIILAVVLGNKAYLGNEFLESVRSIGLAHLFAVSGLHIGVLYIFFIKMFGFFGINKKKSLIISCTILWIYGFFIGFPVSVLRTLFMFTIVLGSHFLYRKNNSLNALFLAAMILLIVNPFWMFDIGFQLSFSAALSLIIYSKYISKILNLKHKISNDVLALLFLEIFSLPILAYHFNYIPILGIIYNIFFIPIFTIVLITCFILVLIGWINISIINIVFKLLNYILYSLYYFIELFDNFFINGVKIYSFGLMEFVAYYLYLLILFYINKVKLNKLRIFTYSFFVILVIHSILYMDIFNAKLYLNIIDVGQGLSTIVEYKDNNYIIDAGSISTDKIGIYTLLPYMEKRGNFDIDALFISHWHKDHYSAANTLIENLDINNVYSGYINDEIDINAEINLLNEGDRIVVDNNLNLKVLWPDKDYYADNENNMSQVILIEYYGYKILFTGDIEKEVEKILLKNELDTIDILIVPHHGSDTSSTSDFIYSLSPKYAVMSYGKNNYNIPDNDVIDRYKKADSLILSTYNDGEINFIIDKTGIEYSTYISNSNECYSYSIQNITLSVIMLFMVIYYINLIQKNEELIYELFKGYR